MGNLNNYSDLEDQIEFLQKENEWLRFVIEVVQFAQRHNGEKAICSKIKDINNNCDCGVELVKKFLELAVENEEKALDFLNGDEIKNFFPKIKNEELG